jgi:ABC-type transport system involved in multi-copper enzyme maturation permease subunit
MIGAVFYHDMMLAGRRGWQHYLRWIYASWLVTQIGYFAFITSVNFFRPRNSYLTSEVAGQFIPVFFVQQFILLLLAVPTLTAGAITDEKTRGTLQYLLTTQMQSRDLIVGKLLARAVQAIVLFLTGLPLLCFFGAVGGVDLLLLLGLLTQMLVVSLALAAVTLLASVWSRQTRDAVLALSGAGILGYLLIRWLGGPLRLFDPAFVVGLADDPAAEATGWTLGDRLAGSTLAWGLLGGVCVVLAVWRLRAAYRRQLENAGRDRRRFRSWTARPPVGEDPIRWREQHMEGLAPLRSLRLIPRWLVVLLIVILTTLSSMFILHRHLEPHVTFELVKSCVLTLDVANLASAFDSQTGSAFGSLGTIALVLASLVMAIRCSGAIVGERERQTFEALLLTPLTARQIVRGKLWAIMGASYVYLAAYAVPAVLFSALTLGSALFWTVLCLAVTLLAMYFLGAVGLSCSVRATTSWRSLLATLGVGYVGGFVVYLCAMPIILMISLIVLMLLTLVQQFLLRYVTASIAPTTAQGQAEFVTALVISSCIALAVIFWLLSRFALKSAQDWIAQRERVRYWEDEVLPRRRRRKPVRTKS